jgi:REP element-mobilizing transposase RayT
VELALYRHAIESGVELRRLANVGNHLHLLVRAAERKALQRFLRVVSGVIPRLVTGARKGAPVAGRFWDALVYSRVVGWGRELVAVEKYLTKNVLEALGFDGARLRIAADGSPEVAWKDWRE